MSLTLVVVGVWNELILLCTMLVGVCGRACDGGCFEGERESLVGELPAVVLDKLGRARMRGEGGFGFSGSGAGARAGSEESHLRNEPGAREGGQQLTLEGRMDGSHPASGLVRVGR